MKQMYSLSELETKLEKLREDYKTSKLEDRKILQSRAKALKIAISMKQSKYGMFDKQN